jgi:hypothetical protein
MTASAFCGSGLRESGKPRIIAPALSESADAIAAVLKSAAGSGGRVPNSPPAAVTHEAHHRGQIAMLAHQLGRPLSPEAMLGMWEAGQRRKEGSRRKGSSSAQDEPAALMSSLSVMHGHPS